MDFPKKDGVFLQTRDAFHPKSVWLQKFANPRLSAEKIIISNKFGGKGREDLRLIQKRHHGHGTGRSPITSKNNSRDYEIVSMQL